jgi:hypothetical protein
MSEAAVRALALQHHVLVAADNPFQRRARLLQALWREEQGLPIGEHRGEPLGSQLAMPEAREGLLNFLTEGIRRVVRAEVLDPVKARDKLYGQPRLFDNLLSSQPLCFNLFAELQGDLALTTRVLRSLTDGMVEKVTAIEFEHSPGRGDAAYTGDRSAFDVFIEFVDADGYKGFLGVEVKYHEGLGDKPAPHRDRYDEVAEKMRCFRRGSPDRLKTKPLQQIWRDHLLAGALLRDQRSAYRHGVFVFLYPNDNDRCASAVQDYRACLSDETSFRSWTLERLLEAVRAASGGPWAEAFADRYLAFEKIDRALAASPR